MITAPDLAVYRHTNAHMQYVVVVKHAGDWWVVRLRPGGWRLRTQYVGRLDNLRPAGPVLVDRAHQLAGVPEVAAT